MSTINYKPYSSEDSTKLVVFQLDGQKFALPLNVVRRVIQIVEISALPNAPRYVCGIVNMHGEIISVINMRHVLGMPAKEVELSDKLLIVSSSSVQMALWIDDVHEVVEVLDKNLVNSEVLKYGDIKLKGIVKLESGMVLINDVEKFLDAKELEVLEKAINEIKL